MTSRVLTASAIGAVALGCVPAASVAADRIVFSRSSNQQAGGYASPRLWTIQSNGKRLHRLKTSSKVVSPDLSRDGRKLVWIHYSPNELVVGDRDAAHPRVVYKRRGASAAGYPRWSPSGGALAFSQSATAGGVDRVGVLDLRSKKVRTFEGLSLGGWSPDSRTIVGASSAPGQIPCSPPLPPNGPIPCYGRLPSLTALDTQTGAIRTILSWPVGSVFAATWSPDGSLIAFDHTDADSDAASPVYQIWVVRPDGGGLRQVTTLATGGSSPSWSPDGRKLAFLARTANGKAHVATIGLDGSGLRRLTRDEYHLGAPDWGS